MLSRTASPSSSKAAPRHVAVRTEEDAGVLRILAAHQPGLGQRVHRDDVRTAPIFDELWQVTETGDGGSQLHVLAPGADVGEL